MSTESAEPRNGRVGVGGNSKAGRNGRYKLDGGEIGDNEVDDKVDDEVGKKSQKTFKFKNLFKSKKSSKSKKTVESDFFTSRARLTFIKLRQAFLKALILYHFHS